MSGFSAENATEIVVDRNSNCEDARLAEVMRSVTHHLHAIVREVRPTPEEWLRAIEFLTATGQISDDKRKEFILLSDTLGVTMLVDALNHPKPPGATESTVLGPFHVAGAETLEMGANICRDDKGEPIIVRGRVLDLERRPISGARLDVWQTNAEGFYDVQQPDQQPEMNLRGQFVTGDDGAFWFRTVRPVSYPIPEDGPVGQLLRSLGRHPYRPGHIHFILSAPGHEGVTTHLFLAGDEYLSSDAVFGVKDALVVEAKSNQRADDAAFFGLPGPFAEIEYDFVLVPES